MLKLSSIFKNILFGITVFLLILIPLFPKFPLLNVPGTFVAIRGEDIILALGFLCLFIYLIVSKNLTNFIKDKLTLALLVFFLIGLISLFSAYFLTQTISPHLGMLHFLRRVEYILLLPLAFWSINSKMQVQICLLVLSIVVFLVNIYAFGQQYLSWPVISTGNSEFSKGLILELTTGARVNSTFAGHYDLAIFLVMAITLLTGLFFVYKNIFLKGWIVMLSLLSFVVLIMTAARLSFVAVLISVMTTLLLLKKKILVLIFIVLACLVLVYPSQLRDRLVSTLTVNILNQGQRHIGDEREERRQSLNIPTLITENDEQYFEATKSATQSSKAAPDIVPGEPIDTTQLGVYRSLSIRLDQEWPRAIRAFLKNPFFGTGYSSLGLATDNDFLRSLGEVGMLGTILFVLIFIEVTKRIIKNFKSQDRFIKYFAAATLTMILAFVINGLFIDVFEASKIASLFWMIIGINLATSKLQK